MHKRNTVTMKSIPIFNILALLLFFKLAMHLLKVWLNGTQYKDVKWGMGVESARFHGIVNGESLWNVFCCLHCIFYCQTTPILKTLGQFENLVFVIMSTRENIRLIAKTSLCPLYIQLFICLPRFMWMIQCQRYAKKGGIFPEKEDERHLCLCSGIYACFGACTQFKIWGQSILYDFRLSARSYVRGICDKSFSSGVYLSNHSSDRIHIWTIVGGLAFTPWSWLQSTGSLHFGGTERQS